MANRKFELKNSSSDVNSIPCVGFGLWKVPKDVCADVVFNGIKTTRHLPRSDMFCEECVFLDLSVAFRSVITKIAKIAP